MSQNEEQVGGAPAGPGRSRRETPIAERIKADIAALDKQREALVQQ